MTTVTMTANYTGLNGKTYTNGQTYQLRSREAYEILRNNKATALPYKGK